jgi:tetratricopeptide (TPR) repeat protein
MTLVANYTLDLATRLEMFDRMSLSVKVDLDTVRQLLIKDDVQDLYLEGLDYYSRGELSEAIRYWENCLSLDPTFKPAREMLETAMKSMELEQELRSTLIQ